MKNGKFAARRPSGSKKVFTVILAALLLVGCSIGATLAYLTATTTTVTNTFTAGNVSATLDEAKVDQYGNRLATDGSIYTGATGQTPAARVTSNTYKLVPGRTYVKDPTVHIAAGSEPCYVFVKVVNPIAGIEGDNTIAAQMAEKGWTSVDEGYPDVYAWPTVVSTSATTRDISVFDSFTIKSDASLASSYAPITVQAAVVQADGFTDFLDAWAANDGLFVPTTPVE